MMHQMKQRTLNERELFVGMVLGTVRAISHHLLW